MSPDPRWLEILKASGWQTAALSAACGALLLLSGSQMVPALASWMVIAATFGLLACGFLTAASVLSALVKVLPIHRWLTMLVNHWRSQRAVRSYIPYMTQKERQIIAYLLGHNQKMFTASQDGGHAATLLSRGIVAITIRSGQIVNPEDVPMAVPDVVWKVFEKHRSAFPIEPEALHGPHPWRVDWMERI